MLDKLKPKSEFSRNVLTLMTGTTIAQAIPIAISPILTRIYSPEDFGVFALYASIASILSVVATGRYELAIMLPKKDSDAINIVALSIVISFFVSFIVLLIVWFFNAEISSLLGNPEISNWLYFIPFSVLLTGLYQSFNYWSNRKKEYKRLATSRVVQTASSASSNITLGVSKVGGAGLILSALFGQIVATSILGRLIWAEGRNKLTFVKKLKILALGKKYKDFPTINLSHSFLNIFSSQIPILLISHYFSSYATGLYSLANRIILLPMGIVTSSYGQVFLENMTSLYNMKQYEKLNIFFYKTLKNLIFISLLPSAFLFLYAPDIFSLIFGEAWKEAGIYTRILIPMLYLRFTGSIISSVVIIYNEQTKALKLEVIMMVLRVLALFIGGLYHSIIIGLILFSIVSSMMTIYRIYWYSLIIKDENGC